MELFWRFPLFCLLSAVETRSIRTDRLYGGPATQTICRVHVAEQNQNEQRCAIQVNGRLNGTNDKIVRVLSLAFYNWRAIASSARCGANLAGDMQSRMIWLP